MIPARPFATARFGEDRSEGKKGRLPCGIEPIQDVSSASRKLAGS
jgi:hypothetical protein